MHPLPLRRLGLAAALALAALPARAAEEHLDFAEPIPEADRATVEALLPERVLTYPSFQDPEEIAALLDASRLERTDLDGDGLVDLLVRLIHSPSSCSEDGCQILGLRNTGTGYFHAWDMFGDTMTITDEVRAFYARKLAERDRVHVVDWTQPEGDERAFVVDWTGSDEAAEVLPPVGRYDLNGDGTPELMLYNWDDCTNEAGCQILVFEKRGDGYELIYENWDWGISVSPQIVGGYRTLVLPYGGDVMWNGTAYDDAAAPDGVDPVVVE